MKNNLFKRVLATILICMMAVLSLTGVETNATSKHHMKDLKVSWDLKPDKQVAYKTKYAGISDLKEGKVTIKNYKIKNTEKKGYKKLTFTLVFKPATKFTKKEIHKITNSEYCKETGQVGTVGAMKFVDYTTGKSLEYENDCDVTVKYGDVEALDTKRLSDEHGCWIEVAKTMKLKVTITYPKDYKNLCIVVGGQGELDNKNDTKFDEGKVEFGKTSYVDKKISHVMRVK